jgi:ribosomal protein L24E
MNEGARCAVCGGPFHPATGGLHFVEKTGRWVPFCGMCERELVKWVAQHTRRKWWGIRFYDHATYRGCVEGPDKERT